MLYSKSYEYESWSRGTEIIPKTVIHCLALSCVKLYLIIIFKGPKQKYITVSATINILGNSFSAHTGMEKDIERMRSYHDCHLQRERILIQ